MLPSVDGMVPESWLLDKDKRLHDTRTATTSRLIMPPDAACALNQPNAHRR
jgi:hypothetical protein